MITEWEDEEGIEEQFIDKHFPPVVADLINPDDYHISAVHEMDNGECIHPGHPEACAYPTSIPPDIPPNISPSDMEWLEKGTK